MAAAARGHVARGCALASVRRCRTWACVCHRLQVLSKGAHTVVKVGNPRSATEERAVSNLIKCAQSSPITIHVPPHVSALMCR